MTTYIEEQLTKLEQNIIDRSKTLQKDSLENCIDLSIWQEQMENVYGNVNSKEYKKRSVNLRRLSGATKQQLSKDVQVGKYLRENNSSDLRNMSKTSIYNKYCKVKTVTKPKISKKSAELQEYQNAIIKIRDWANTYTQIKWEPLLTKLNIDPSIFE